MSTFHEISSYFGSAVQASVDDKVAVYLASIRLAGEAAIVPDNEREDEAVYLSDRRSHISKPHPWSRSSSSNSTGTARRARNRSESSGSSYSESEGIHDCSASRRPVNSAWNPNDLSLRLSSPPQTFYSAREEIPAYWLQTLPTPQASISEERTAMEEDLNTPAPDAAFPLSTPLNFSAPLETQEQASEMLDEIDESNEIDEKHDDERAFVTSAVLTPTDNASSHLPRGGEGISQEKMPLWRRLSTRKRTIMKDHPSSTKNTWRVTLQFLAGRLLHRGT